MKNHTQERYSLSVDGVQRTMVYNQASTPADELVCVAWIKNHKTHRLWFRIKDDFYVIETEYHGNSGLHVMCNQIHDLAAQRDIETLQKQMKRSSVKNFTYIGGNEERASVFVWRRTVTDSSFVPSSVSEDTKPIYVDNTFIWGSESSSSSGKHVIELKVVSLDTHPTLTSNPSCYQSK